MIAEILALEAVLESDDYSSESNDDAPEINVWVRAFKPMTDVASFL